MHQIEGIYILEEDNSMIYNSELSLDLKEDFDYNLFFDLIKSFEMIAAEMNSKVKQISIDNSKFYITNDPIKGTKFIMKTVEDFYDAAAAEILKQIENLYINKFLARILKNKYDKAEILESFNKDLRVLIDENVVDPIDFLENL